MDRIKHRVCEGASAENSELALPAGADTAERVMKRAAVGATSSSTSDPQQLADTVLQAADVGGHLMKFCSDLDALTWTCTTFALGQTHGAEQAVSQMPEPTSSAAAGQLTSRSEAPTPLSSAVAAASSFQRCVVDAVGYCTGFTRVEAAIKQNNPSRMTELIRCGADVNLIHPVCDLSPMLAVERRADAQAAMPQRQSAVASGCDSSHASSASSSSALVGQKPLGQHHLHQSHHASAAPSYSPLMRCLVWGSTDCLRVLLELADEPAASHLGADASSTLSTPCHQALALDRGKLDIMGSLAPWRLIYDVSKPGRGDAPFPADYVQSTAKPALELLLSHPSFVATVINQQSCQLQHMYTIATLAGLCGGDVGFCVLNRLRELDPTPSSHLNIGDWVSDATYAAETQGNVDVVQWAIDDCEQTTGLDFVWLCENYSPGPPGIAAAQHGHIHILRLLHDQMLLVDTKQHMAAAARAGNIDALAFAIRCTRGGAVGVKVPSTVAAAAIEGNQIGVLRWLHGGVAAPSEARAKLDAHDHATTTADGALIGAAGSSCSAASGAEENLAAGQGSGLGSALGHALSQTSASARGHAGPNAMPASTGRFHCNITSSPAVCKAASKSCSTIDPEVLRWLKSVGCACGGTLHGGPA